jgi:hypothetical protein
MGLALIYSFEQLTPGRKFNLIMICESSHIATYACGIATPSDRQSFHIVISCLEVVFCLTLIFIIKLLPNLYISSICYFNFFYERPQVKFWNFPNVHFRMKILLEGKNVFSVNWKIYFVYVFWFAHFRTGYMNTLWDHEWFCLCFI